MSEVSKESKLEVKLEVKSKDSEDELKSENLLFKWFFDVEYKSKEDEVKDELEVSWVWIKEVLKDEWEEVSFKGGRKVGRAKDAKESMTFLKKWDPFLFLKMVLTFLSLISFLENLCFFFKLEMLFWSSWESSWVSSAVKIKDLRNLEELRWNEKEDSKLEIKLEDGFKDKKEDWIKEGSLFLRGGKVFLKSGAFAGLLLGLNEVEVFTLEAKLFEIKAEVKVEILDLFFFEWGERESRFLEKELGEVLNSFSDNGIPF